MGKFKQISYTSNKKCFKSSNGITNYIINLKFIVGVKIDYKSILWSIMMTSQ